MKSFYQLIVIVLAVAVFVTLIKKQSFDYDYVDSTVEYFVDELVDNGFLQNDYLMGAELRKSRKIVTSTNVNAHFSKELVSQILLLSQDGTKQPIDIYLRTEGGWEADVFAVIDVMRSIDMPVNVHAVGEVHSAGLMILSAATGKRYVYPHTILSFHSLYKFDEPEVKDRYKQFFKSHTKIPKDWIDDESDSLFYMTAEQAIEYGVADELFPAE